MSTLNQDPMRNLPVVTPPPTGNKRAAGWQKTVTAIAAIAIVAIFLWGLNNQRDESTGEQSAGTQPTPVAPQGASPPPAQAQNQQQTGAQQQDQDNGSATTGQGNKGDKGDDGQNSAPRRGAGGQDRKSNTAQQNPPAEDNRTPAQSQAQ